MLPTLTDNFQSNIDALKKWVDDWGMELNSTNCHILGFNTKRAIPKYTLGNSTLGHVEETKYFGVVLHLLRFDTHIIITLTRLPQNILS